MNELLELVDGQLTISTITIATHTENQHHTITRIIRDNTSDFEEFGKLGFKIQAIKNSKNKTNEIKLYNLNEEQYSLLMTYLRNNEKVKAFKKNMVKAFFMMKNKTNSSNEQSDLQKILNQIEKQNQEIQNLKNQLILKEQEKENPFKGFYENRNRELGKRENSFLYSRDDWMMLLNECETQLGLERNGKSKTLLISRGSAK